VPGLNFVVRIKLYQKYVTEGLSTVEIGRAAGTSSPYSVAFRLKKFGIRMRNMSEARTCKNYTPFFFDKEVIEGLGTVEPKSRDTSR
jgi:hypothetical protein